MCGGFSYTAKHPETGESMTRKVFFPIPHAQLPVLTENGIEIMQWGKRKGEDPEVDVPVTGWARIASLSEGKWNAYHPQRVRIPALQWMEKDSTKTSHWFDMEPDSAMLGVKIVRGDRNFVYIVTRPATGIYQDVHDRMPMIVKVDALTAAASC
jgi:putative SOS response-associated peptidase YedK